MKMSTRTFENAVKALNTLQGRTTNPIRARADVLAALPRAGLSLSALDGLNVVHVAGTKGKGTTCAMVASILARAAPGARIGLHTSPHLVSVRERIRIDGQPLSEAQFTASFFAVWDALAAAAARDGVPFDESTPLDPARPGLRPAYARFLLLVAFEAFLRQGVDVAVVETGIGGEGDATNVVEHPAATGITSLGLDHTEVLGGTIEQIAWHKAGIFKTGSPALTVKQDYDETMAVLEARAAEKGVALETVGDDPRLSGVKILPDAGFQRRNASLAVRLAETVLPRLDRTFRPGPTLPQGFVRGLEEVRWRGRCEARPDDDGVTWFLDCAHTRESLGVAARWFAQTAGRGRRNVLVFNQQIRATATSLLDIIHGEGVFFDKAFFSTPQTYAAGFKSDHVNRHIDPAAIRDMTVQRNFAAHWRTRSPETDAVVVPSVEETVARVRGYAREVGEVNVFVTGGVHIVGGFLSVIEEVDAL